MLRVYDIVEEIEKVAPLEEALSFDNVGLIVGSLDSQISGILVCLDVTEEVIEEAKEKGANLIISHHPFIFDPINRIEEDNARGKLISLAIKNDLNIYSAHTNWDYAKRGVNYALINKLDLKGIKRDKDDKMFFASLKEGLDIDSFIVYLKDKLDLKGMRYILPKGLENKVIKRIGVSGGSFDGQREWIYENNLDALVTGEVKHSDAIDFNMDPFITFVVGHYESEIFGMEEMERFLSSKFSKNTRISMATREINPFKYS